jgi:hypothetical protein
VKKAQVIVCAMEIHAGALLMLVLQKRVDESKLLLIKTLMKINYNTIIYRTLAIKCCNTLSLVETKEILSSKYENLKRL